MEEDEEQRGKRPTRTGCGSRESRPKEAHQHYIGAEDSIQEHVVRGFDLFTE